VGITTLIEFLNKSYEGIFPETFCDDSY
jgi:hypothetical protein